MAIGVGGGLAVLTLAAVTGAAVLNPMLVPLYADVLIEIGQSIVEGAAGGARNVIRAANDEASDAAWAAARGPSGGSGIEWAHPDRVLP